MMSNENTGAHRLLVVDDEPLVSQMLQRALTAKGYLTETASCGEEALRKVTPELDLLLLDVDLPDLDGFEVTRRIRQDDLLKHLPILIVTGRDTRQDRIRAVEVGATDFIGKPVDLMELSVRTTSLLRMKEAQDSLQRHQAELERMVTERTAALVQARDDALAASRAKSAFVAQMSHEFRTPLNHIIGFSDMLLEEATSLGEAGWVAELKTIQQSGEHLLELTNKVLEFAAAEAGKSSLTVEAFSLSNLLSHEIDRVRPLAEQRGSCLSVERAAVDIVLHTDANKLSFVFRQVIENACAFTREGAISVATKLQRIGNADWVQISVADTGKGMTPEEIRRVFEPFWQADLSSTRTHGGMGLGLALARAYAHLLGGDIRAESQVGQGSVFTFRLPIRLPLASQFNIERDQGCWLGEQAILRHLGSV